MEMSRIQFALCGSYGMEKELNPYAVAGPETCQEILSLINRQAQALEEIANKLKLSRVEVAHPLEALQRAGLVEEVGGEYKPSFAIFTVGDQEKLEPLVARMTDLYAEAVRGEMEAVHKTYADCGFARHGFSFTDIAYILVGAYILDYGGLALHEAGLLVAEKPMPGGAYVFTGFEGELRNLKASWMWGHSYSFPPYTFFGHGEVPPEGRRHAFPEQAYQWWADGWSDEGVSSVMKELGAILVALCRSPMVTTELAGRTEVEHEKVVEHLRLLEELQYVQEKDLWSSLCPVVDDAAKTQIEQMIRKVWDKLLDVAVRPNLEHLERLYDGTAPAGNGIDVQEAFNPIHHAIFEQALGLLVERGVIARPRNHADGARYAVWIEYQEDREVKRS